MKPYPAIIIYAFLLASCSSSDQLSNAECKAIYDKQNAIAVEAMGPGDYPMLMSTLNESTKKGIDECVSGDGYNRIDYECFLKAEKLKDINECVAKSKQHIKR